MHSALWRNHVTLLRAVKSSQCQFAQRFFQALTARQSIPEGLVHEGNTPHGGDLWFRETAWSNKGPSGLLGSQSLCTAAGMNPLQQTPQVPLESDASGTAVANYVPLR